MVDTPYGWVNVAVNNFWDYFFMAYYVTFSLAGLVLVWRWGKKAAAQNIKRQARLIVLSMLITICLGSLTDIFGSLILGFSVPQMAPVLMLYPVSIFYYCIRRYSFMRPKTMPEGDFIVNEQVHAKMFIYLASAAIAGAFINFITQYFFLDNSDPIPALCFSVALILLGFIVLLIQNSRLSSQAKNIYNAIAISLTVPIITLKFINSASMTVWAFPIILLLFALIFSERLLLITVSASIFITQIVVWIIHPQLDISIDATDYMTRIGIFVLAVWFAFYVNKAYVSKIRENNEQINYQKLISGISGDYLTVNADNFYEKNNQTLALAGQFFGADHAYIYLFTPERDRLVQSYCWNRGAQAPEENGRAIPVKECPWITNQIKNGTRIYAPDVCELDAEQNAELGRLGAGETKTALVLPIVSQDVVLGLIGFDFIKSAKALSGSQTDCLAIITNIVADAMQKVQQEKEINQMAYYDHLTGLPNRVLFKDRVNQAIHLSTRAGRTIAILFLDLDSFKSVNDTVGHQGGDDLLTKVARELSKSVRKSDTVSRFGGDEFLVMLSSMGSIKDIVKITQKIMGLFKKPFIIHGQEFFITASGGIAIYPTDGEDADALIKNADIAMYNAKEKGKNRFELCSPNMKEEVLMKIRLSNNLYRALDRKELVIHYQPQISVQSKQIIGLEALLRWNHPEMGLISPVRFIPLAEQSGLISPIGEWVLRTACAQNKAWQDAGLASVRMAINISVNQFRNPEFVSQVENILRDTKLDPQYLELEITESIAIKESDYIIEILNRLKKLGLSISIDDFGTEYSSLSRLKLLPIDRIKMDMQFVHGINSSDKDRAITKVIISLAQNLGLKVIAEGVETEQQLEFLSQRMCDEVQGFYYYQPMPAQEVEPILREYSA